MPARARTPPTRPGAPRRTGTTVRALTLRLDPEPFRQLALLAAVENWSPTNYVETLILRAIEDHAESQRDLGMRVAPEARGLDPGPMLQGEGESGRRHKERQALFDELLALPDSN